MWDWIGPKESGVGPCSLSFDSQERWRQWQSLSRSAREKRVCSAISTQVLDFDACGRMVKVTSIRPEASGWRLTCAMYQNPASSPWRTVVEFRRLSRVTEEGMQKMVEDEDRKHSQRSKFKIASCRGASIHHSEEIESKWRSLRTTYSLVEPWRSTETLACESEGKHFIYWKRSDGQLRYIEKNLFPVQSWSFQNTWRLYVTWVQHLKLVYLELIIVLLSTLARGFQNKTMPIRHTLLIQIFEKREYPPILLFPSDRRNFKPHLRRTMLRSSRLPAAHSPPHH